MYNRRRESTSSQLRNSSGDISFQSSEGSGEKNKEKQPVGKSLQSLNHKKDDDDNDDFDPDYNSTKDDNYQSYINIYDNVSESPIEMRNETVN